MFFYDFRFTTCGCDVFFVRSYDNRSIYPGRAPVIKFIYSFKQNIKYTNVVILLVYVDTNHMYKYFGKCIFILNQTTVTDNNFTKLCIKLPDGFQCSLPLLGLDTPNEIFYYIQMAVDIYINMRNSNYKI